jgi:hypothetical protein
MKRADRASNSAVHLPLAETFHFHKIQMALSNSHSSAMEKPFECYGNGKEE